MPQDTMTAFRGGREGGGGGEEGREGGHAEDNIHRLTKLHLSLEFTAEGGLIIEYNIPIRDFPVSSHC